jgi:hypothetical protein
MAIVFILPGLVLITLGLVSLFGLSTPESQPKLSLVKNETQRDYKIAA